MSEPATFWTFEYQEPDGAWRLSLVRAPSASKAAEYAAKWLTNMAVRFGSVGVSVRLITTDQDVTLADVEQRMKEATEC